MCYQAAQAMYQQLALFESQLKQQSAQLSGHLKIQVVSRIHHDAYTEFLHQFKQHHPSVTFDIEVLSSADILRNLSQKSLCWALLYAATCPTALSQKLLFNQRYALYCGYHHPLFHASDVSMAQLGKQDFISFSKRANWQRVVTLDGVQRHPRLHRQNHHHHQQLGRSGALSIRRLWHRLFAHAPSSAPHLQAALKLLPPKDGVADIPVYLLWHQERVLSALEERFIQELMQVDFSMQPNIKLNL